MNKNFINILLAGLSIFSLSIGSCVKNTDHSGDGDSFFNLDNNNTTYHGNRTKDASLKAITIPCQNNNTFRLYYSDSAAQYGLPDSIRIVSYSKRTSLGYHEACIEATSSGIDTYLSTGSDSMDIKTHDGIFINNAVVRHYTSGPEPDSTYILASLAAE